MEPYEVDFLERFDRGEKFDRNELKECRYDFLVVDEIEGDAGRWTTAVRTIFEVGGRFFSLRWDRGLTEMQENEFMYQPKEVVKRTYEKTIEVTEWMEVNNE